MFGGEESKAEHGNEVGPQDLRAEVANFRQVVEQAQNLRLDGRLVLKPVRIEQLDEQAETALLHVVDE